MNKNIFVNLPVKNLPKSIEFFKTLGYDFNPQFTDETAACLIIGANIYAMLLTEEKFKGFTPLPISDAKRATEVLIALSCESRSEVQEILHKAVQAGGTTFNPPQDYGFMYCHSFQDLDGHIWEYLYMDPAHVQPQT